MSCRWALQAAEKNEFIDFEFNQTSGEPVAISV
jgi:hypothetical protein